MLSSEASDLKGQMSRWMRKPLCPLQKARVVRLEDTQESKGVSPRAKHFLDGRERLARPKDHVKSRPNA
jgi:hypothetical protein